MKTVSNDTSFPRMSLPVDALLPAILDSLQVTPNLVLEAAPGAGKTTRVPPVLLELVSGEVLVLEPRRIAARMAARRVASEMGEKVGETVGYQVRFEEVASTKTRLRFVTEGILTRRLLSDPELKGVDAVVLDEFHERHIDSDLALALLRRLQCKRPELLIVVMSATLDAAPIAAYLHGCPILRSEGRAFPLTIEHQPYSSLPLEQQVRAAVERLLQDGQSGHMLVFLPGSAEIRRAMRECDGVARKTGLLMLPLHGSLSPAEQDRVVAPSREQKLILATNVAESSVTVEGVTAVIDSGLARIATWSRWTGLPTLQLARVSKASATQRAGRAGRTAAGRVLRLYSQEDFQHRPEQDMPEIERSELSHLALALRVMLLDVRTDIPWLSAPPEEAMVHAEELLDRLGATGSMLAKLARYPLPPRLARVVVEAVERGVGQDGCIVAALLSEAIPMEQQDLLEAVDAVRASRVHDQRLMRQVDQLKRIARVPSQMRQDDDALLLSVLAGFSDRVGRLRAGNLVLLSSGTSAELAGQRPQYEFLIAVDAEDRKDKPQPMIRMAARMEPEWLIELFSERVREQSVISWNRSAERVEQVDTMLYDALVIEESRVMPKNAEAAASILAEEALEAGIGRFVDETLLQEFLARVEFAGLDQPEVGSVLRELCLGLRSFAELKSAAGNLMALLEQSVAQSAGHRRLAELAPARIRLASGRETRVHYEQGKSPWIASRLQDFFGMRETPRIGPERTPVVTHLLAPNQRAVQMTSDLAGFWERLYPQVRRELMRRYPRHAWPEKP